MAATFSAYVICATPRSGSTLLCDLLTASSVAGWPQSYLRSQDVERRAAAWQIREAAHPTDPAFNRSYIAAMTRAGTAGTGMFGLRLMWPSVVELATRLAAALGGGGADIARLIEQRFGPTLFIHLTRLDKLAQAVSLVRAEQTGLWHVAADGSERQRTAPARPPVFDADRIESARDMLASEDGQWSRFFAAHGIRPLRLTYEALAADPRAVLRETLTALGRDPSSAERVKIATARMADAISAAWAERIRSI